MRILTILEVKPMVTFFGNSLDLNYKNGQVLQCHLENREQLKYVRIVISDQSHARNLLAKPQTVFR